MSSGTSAVTAAMASDTPPESGLLPKTCRAAIHAAGTTAEARHKFSSRSASTRAGKLNVAVSL